METLIPTSESIIAAHERIKKYVHNTPIMSSEAINNLTGANIIFKCENFQKVGAFKMRGATNAVLSLDKKELENGVATHSSGNHAAALSLAAKKMNIPSYIVMPETAPAIKKKAVENYGGQITYCRPNQQARESALEYIVKTTSATFIHPYDNYKIIEGQATCAKEVYEDDNKLDFIITPVGGGGLLSGTCLSTKYFSPETKVIGAEPEGADDAFRSIRDKRIYPSINPKTIADGLLTSFSEKTYRIVLEHVEKIILASDLQIINSMRIIWERMKIIVEPSSAVTLAVVLNNPSLFKHKKVCCVLSGGNVDLKNLPW
jgi:threonine dehydratase